MPDLEVFVFACTPKTPWNHSIKADRITHEGGHCVGECFEGCCDQYECSDCGRWKIEVGQ